MNKPLPLVGIIICIYVLIQRPLKGGAVLIVVVYIRVSSAFQFSVKACSEVPLRTGAEEGVCGASRTQGAKLGLSVLLQHP